MGRMEGIIKNNPDLAAPAKTTSPEVSKAQTQAITARALEAIAYQNMSMRTSTRATEPVLLPQ